MSTLTRVMDENLSGIRVARASPRRITRWTSSTAPRGAPWRDLSSRDLTNAEEGGPLFRRGWYSLDDIYELAGGKSATDAGPW